MATGTIVASNGRKMMLSFVPPLDLQQQQQHAGEGRVFNKYMFRSFVNLNPKTTTVADIIQVARESFSNHLERKAAYYKRPLETFSIGCIWAGTASGPLQGVAVPLTQRDWVLSDAVTAPTGGSGFGASQFGVGENSVFSRLPPDMSFTILQSLSLAERRDALAASRQLRGVWDSRVLFDLPGEELYFEVLFD